MTTATAEPTAPHSRRWYGRKRYVVPLALFLVALLAAGAYALFFAKARLSGSIKAGEFRVGWILPVDLVDPTTISGENPTGSATASSARLIANASIVGDIGTGDSRLNITAGGGYLPGDSARLTTAVQVQGSTDGRITGLDLGALPTGVTAEVTTGCGVVVPRNNSQGVPVSITFTVKDTAALAGAVTTLPATAGLQIAPAAQAWTEGTPCKVGN